MKNTITIMTLLAMLVMPTQMWAEGPKVQTKSGVIEGVDASGVKTFKGVPFAKPPVGELRWRAPQPVEHWEGVRETKAFGPNPMQQPIFGDMAFGTKKMSEDCLYLNIWTPAKTMDERLPVMIYFNGGGLQAGSGSEPRYAGDVLARRGGIICITANYREGIFGFFAHEELSKETSYGGSGNYGLMDQAAAIAWVKDNISAFGGDPSQITIVGESAGGMSVSALMASPLAKYNISRAIASSGSVIAMKKIMTLHEAEEAGAKKAAEMGCSHISQLRALPAEELMEKANFRESRFINIDNHFFTEQPYDTYKEGHQANIPLLVGGNSEELPLSLYLGGQPATLENARQACVNVWGKEKGELMFEAYHFQTDADLQASKGMELSSDLFLAYGTWKFGNMHKKSSHQPVYRYLYCRVRPKMRKEGLEAALAGGTKKKEEGAPESPAAKGAVHSADIEYAMATLPTNCVFDWQPEDYAVSEIFSKYYINFVKTGNPNGLGLADWQPTCSAAVEPVMQIDVDCTMKSDSELEKRYETFDIINWGE